MPAELVKQTIDIGIVTTNKDALVNFYGSVVGFPNMEDVRMDGFVVSRFQVGDCVLKILEFDAPPAEKSSGGGLGDAAGIRYWTVSVSNLDEILESVQAAGRPVIDGPTEVRPGVSIALVTDPDDNIVEFVSRNSGQDRTSVSNQR